MRATRSCAVLAGLIAAVSPAAATPPSPPAVGGMANVYTPLLCNGDIANAAYNTKTLQDAIDATYLVNGQHKRRHIYLPDGQCYLNAGVLTVKDIEGGASTTRGLIAIDGVGLNNTELTFTGSGDALLIKSGRVRLGGFTLDSDGVTRGFTTSSAPVSTASVARNAMTINAKTTASVGDIAIYTKAKDPTFDYAAVVVAATPTSVKIAAARADGSTSGGNLRILHALGAGRGIAVDPGASATNHITVSDFYYFDILVSHQPGDCFYFQNPEQLSLHDITGVDCGGIGLNLNGDDYSSGRTTSIGNVIERARMINNGSYGFQDFASAGTNHYIAPEALQNYGSTQFRVAGGGIGPIIDAPDIEAQRIPAAGYGIGSNKFGLQMGSAKTIVNGGLIDAGSFATILMQGNGERVNGTTLYNYGHMTTGSYFTSNVIDTSPGLKNINANFTIGGSITLSTPITNVMSVLTDPTNVFIEAGIPKGPITLPKLSAAPANAPGAGLCQVFAVAATTPGAGKVQVICGTSATPSTLLDNIGAGF